MVKIALIAMFFSTSLFVSCSSPETDTLAQKSEISAPGKPGEALESTEEMVATLGDFSREGHLGGELFADNCASCHIGGNVPKAPDFTWLEMMSPDAIHSAMTDGVMQLQAEHLSANEKRELTEWITRQDIEDINKVERPVPPMCEGKAAEFDISSPAPKIGWGHDTARHSPKDVAGFDADDLKNMELKWAFAYPGALRARSQPSIAMGAIYTGSQDGTVYAFDLETGCAKWIFRAPAEVRTAIVISSEPASADAPPLAFFGDLMGKFYTVNALTGDLVWSKRMDDHPSTTLTGSPAYHDGNLYIPVSSLEVIAAADPNYACCTFRGKVVKVDARSGKIIWEHFTVVGEPKKVGKTSVGTPIISPSGAPVWSSPAIDEKRGLIYFGSGENYSSPTDGNSDAIIAVDMKLGERVWTKQSYDNDAWNVACMMVENPNCPPEDGPDFDHGSSMILADLDDGKEIMFVGFKDGRVMGLDPDKKGETLWTVKVGRGSIQGGVHFGMATDGTKVYAPINDMNDTRNGDILDPELARPGIHTIDARNGKVLWSHVQKNVCPENLKFCDPGVSAAITSFPGGVIAGHMDGFIRGYDGETGKVLWEYDTKQTVKTVNNIQGSGGSMSGAGAAIAAGHIAVNSGYGLYSHSPGNLLLVFAPKAN